jgi:nitrogen-specific signal transduction histidine kinase/uncharacterized membrane protein YgcG
MGWAATPYSLVAFVAATVTAVLALFALRHRAEPYAGSFIALMVAVTTWAVVYGVQLGFDGVAQQLTWFRSSLAIAGTVPTLWLLFTLQYTGYDERLSRRYRRLLAVEPAAFVALALTNWRHGLVWSDPKLLRTGTVPVVELFGEGSVWVVDVTLSWTFLLHTLYSYAIILVGMFLLGRVVVSGSSIATRQATLLLVGTTPPFVVNAAYTFGVSPIRNLDATPIAFVVTATFWSFALFQLDLLDRSAMAKRRAIRDVGSGLIVLDEDGIVVEVNDIAQKVFHPPPSVGDCVDVYLPEEATDGGKTTPVRNKSPEPEARDEECAGGRGNLSGGGDDGGGGEDGGRRDDGGGGEDGGYGDDSEPRDDAGAGSLGTVGLWTTTVGGGSEDGRGEEGTTVPDPTALDGTLRSAIVDDRKRVYDLRVTPLEDHSGRTTGYTVVARDVTERHGYEQRLEVANRVLRHNLSNDMNLVVGYARQLEEGVSDDRLRKAARTIHETGTDLIDASEKAREMIEFESHRAEPTTLDLSRPTFRAVSAFRETNPDATISLEIPDSARAVVGSEQGYLTAVHNVVENALEHHDRSDPEVTIRIESGEEWVHVAVCDDGPGMPEMERATFESGTETALRHGSGLGLWLAHWTVTAVGGTLSFADREPRGTEVTLSFPAADENS